jgi:hypothetical protein
MSAVLTPSLQNPGPIIGARTRDIAEGALNVPNMRGAVINWFRPFRGVVVTTTIVEGLSTEVSRPFNCAGFFKPMKARDVLIKPEGDRAFRWFVLYTGREIDFKPNDVVIRKGVPYRVMGPWQLEDYGIKRYELVEDYNAVKS